MEEELKKKEKVNEEDLKQEIKTEVEENIADNKNLDKDSLNHDKENKKDKKLFKKDTKLLAEIEDLKKKNDELMNKFLYSQAEFANFKKRKEQETANMLKYSNMDIARELLPVVDNFERAIKLDDSNLNDELSKFLDGFKMIYSHLVELLHKFEIEEIDCLNKEFDPNFEQALMTVKAEGVEPGIVVEVLQKGYMLKDKMIRPALVKVSE